MFVRRAAHHPYNSPSPNSTPAGLGFVDYINPRRCFDILQGFDFPNLCSPDPSPLNSPVKGSRRLAEESLSVPRIPGRYPTLGCNKRNRASTPTPDIDAPAEKPAPKPAPRKAKHGPKHLSFTKWRNGSGTVSHHHRSQKFKEKRDAAHKQSPEWTRMPRPRHITELRREAQALMKPDLMNDEDAIFLKQLKKLELEEGMTRGLEECREQMARAAAETDKRRKEHRARDKEADKLWAERDDDEASEDQRRKAKKSMRTREKRTASRFRRMEEAALRADQERHRAHEARERRIREEQERAFREELGRKAKEEERRKKEEEECRQQEERERQEKEERRRRFQEQLREYERKQEAFARVLREHKERIARERRVRAAREERERILREERERLAREERERFAREEYERQARFMAEQARRTAEKAEQELQHFLVYEGKWTELRTNDALCLIDVGDMPWPVFGVVASADQITLQEVRKFLFHPQRPGVEGRTVRDKVKAEVLRFHPDKFNARILPKIQPSQQAIAQAIAGAVARILTSIMTEEAEQQN